MVGRARGRKTWTAKDGKVDEGIHIEQVFPSWTLASLVVCSFCRWETKQLWT